MTRKSTPQRQRRNGWFLRGRKFSQCVFLQLIVITVVSTFCKEQKWLLSFDSSIDTTDNDSDGGMWWYEDGNRDKNDDRAASTTKIRTTTTTTLVQGDPSSSLASLQRPGEKNHTTKKDNEKDNNIILASGDDDTASSPAAVAPWTNRTLTIVIPLGGELANHLHYLAGAKYTQQMLWREFPELRDITILGQHQDDPKWEQPFQELSQCFVHFRHNFTVNAGIHDADFIRSIKPRQEELLRQWWLSSHESTRKSLKRAHNKNEDFFMSHHLGPYQWLLHNIEGSPEKITVLKDIWTLQQAQQHGEGDDRTSSSSSGLYYSVPYITSRIFLRHRILQDKSLYHNVRRWFAFNRTNPYCCKQTSFWGISNENNQRQNKQKEEYGAATAATTTKSTNSWSVSLFPNHRNNNNDTTVFHNHNKNENNVVFHFRNFITEVVSAKDRQTHSWLEFSPNETREQLFGPEIMNLYHYNNNKTQPTTPSLKIIGRYPEGLLPYKHALQAMKRQEPPGNDDDNNASTLAFSSSFTGWNHVEVLSVGHSGIQDFCFAMTAPDTLVGLERSTYAFWAGVLGQASLVRFYIIRTPAQHQKEQQKQQQPNANISNTTTTTTTEEWPSQLLERSRLDTLGDSHDHRRHREFWKEVYIQTETLDRTWLLNQKQRKTKLSKKNNNKAKRNKKTKSRPYVARN